MAFFCYKSIIVYTLSIVPLDVCPHEYISYINFGTDKYTILCSAEDGKPTDFDVYAISLCIRSHIISSFANP